MIEYILKNEMKIPENDKKRIKALDNLFIGIDDMPYLNGKTLPKKIKNEITELYYKYISSVYESLSWGYDFVKMEKKSSPHKTSNERYFIMTFILSWACQFKDKVNIDDVFRTLHTREAHVIMFKNAYERIEK